MPGYYGGESDGRQEQIDGVCRQKAWKIQAIKHWRTGRMGGESNADRSARGFDLSVLEKLLIGPAFHATGPGTRGDARC